MQHIPQANLNDFLSEDPDRKAAFVQHVGASFKEIGFLALKGHFLEEKLQEDLYREIKTFFALPTKTKEAYEIQGGGGQRGYTGFGKEHAEGRTTGDLKEFWQVGQPDPPANGDPVHFPSNQRVAELPAFQSTAVDAFRALETLGQTVLRAIAIHLGVEEDYFHNWVAGGNSILRAIHYPPILSAPSSAVRAGQHEDINLITLLMGASAEGLEVLNKQGEWVGITAIPGSLVVNVGDMLQRLTNGYLKSTTHRVVNPPQEKWAQPRYSIPFFLHPVGKMPLNALAQCISEARPKAFTDITAGDYLDERLVEIGLKKK